MIAVANAAKGKGRIVTPMSVTEFKAFVRDESAKYLNVIKETGQAGRRVRGIWLPKAPNARVFSHFCLTCRGHADTYPTLFGRR